MTVGNVVKAMSQDLQIAENTTHMSFQVRFLLGRYHGKEWPPSPRRLFLAFVAALHQNSGRVDFHKGDTAMRFFEKLEAPKICAHGYKGREYKIAVPNNDRDVISRAYAENKTPKDERTMATIKLMKPHITDTVTYFWEVQNAESDDVKALCELAKEIPVLGLGIDPVAVHGSVSKSLIDAGDAPCYVADDRGSERIDVPTEGLLEDARRHHDEFENKVVGDSFYKPTPIRKYRTQRYRKRTPSKDVGMFRIFNTDGSRGALANSKIPQIIEQIYKIKNKYDKNNTIRAEAVAIPTIGKRSDGIVRRVAFLISNNTDEVDRDRFLAHASGQLIEVGNVKYQINAVDSEDPVQKMYEMKSRLWRSVTPVDLDVRGQDVVKSTIAALSKDGITGDVAFVNHGREPYWNGLPSATGKTTHVEIEFKTARSGAFTIGNNVKAGYGLFAPEEMPRVAYFAVLGDRPPIEKTVEVADLTRRAAMSKFKQIFKRTDVPPVISGHSAEPLNHSHALWLPYDADEDGLIDHVAVYVRYGFGSAEMQTLCKITDIFNDSMRMRLHFKRARDTHELGHKCSLFAKCQKWKSVTPYYPPWHIKKNFGVKDQVEREVSHDRPSAKVESVDIKPESTIESHRNKKTPIGLFETRRNGKGPTTGRGRSIEIVFKRPITGPLALGYGKHFGLGMFVPIVDAETK